MNQLLKRKTNQLAEKKKKGFTLVELIIVIAIIAILAVIAIPKFAEIRENANVKADIATANAIQSAVTVAVTNGETGFELPMGEATNILPADKLKSVINGGAIPAPKAKEIKGENKTFSAEIDGKGNVIVKADTKQVLPQVAHADDNPYSKAK